MKNMKQLKHYLYSTELNKNIIEIEGFQSELLLKTIIEHLKQNTTDCLEHHKEYSKEEKKKFFGKSKIVDYYEVNPKTGEPSKCIIHNYKTSYVPLTKISDN
jgi:hypothetical protein